MAILKMKKLRLMVVRSQKDALLRELIRLGCVEFSELDALVQGSEIEGIVKRESSKVMSYRAQQTALIHAVELLDKYAPAKSKLLSAKPELEGQELLSEEGIEAAMGLAEYISGNDDRIKRIAAEESRLRGVVESLEPWLPLDMALNTEGTARCAVLLGSIPTKTELKAVETAIAELTDEAELFLVSEDKSQRYVVIVCIREQLGAIQECLRGYAFSAASMGGMDGTADQCKLKAQQELKEYAAEKEGCVRNITDVSARRGELKLAADKLAAKISLAEAEDKLYGTDSTLMMEGWMPAENEAALEKVLESFRCAWETEEPAEEEYPQVPIKLKNNKLTNGLNMVTEMYSLPAYGSLDPNPLMAPFFILFYGIMMADMGYGLIMIAAAVVAMIKMKPRAGTLSFCQLLLWGGISTFAMGALTGGFFGDALEQIGKIIGMPEGWGRLPSLFSPMTDSMMVLIGAMVLGFIHLNTGMVINVVKKVKRGQIADAVWEEGAIWVTFIGAGLMILKVGNVAGVPVVLVIGIIMVLYGGTRGATGLGKLTSIFGTVYNTLTGWFGDILSYSRLMALMLAGSVIATVFNTIGSIANSLWLFIPVFIIGHALNFALNLLGCYVHDLRLQCLEYFGKFYEDGGRAFEPLKFKTKYYNVAE